MILHGTRGMVSGENPEQPSPFEAHETPCLPCNTFQGLRGSQGMVSGEKPERGELALPQIETPCFPRNTVQHNSETRSPDRAGPPAVASTAPPDAAAGNPLQAQLTALNDQIAAACDANDLTTATRLNEQARRLAIEVFSNYPPTRGGQPL